MNRREFIITVGAGTAVAVAGCSSGGDGADTSSPDAIVESYYQATDEIESDAGTDAILDELDPFLHSASPIPDLIGADDGSNENTDTPDRSLDSVSAEVVEEDVDESALTEDYALGLLGVSESDIADIAEENAIVEASVEYDNGDSEQPEHVTATEDGDWLIVL